MFGLNAGTMTNHNQYSKKNNEGIIPELNRQYKDKRIIKVIF